MIMCKACWLFLVVVLTIFISACERKTEKQEEPKLKETKTVTEGSAPKVADKIVEEKYEPVSISEFKVSMELSGGVGWDEDGKANGGPIHSLSFWGQKLELSSDMIKDGFIHTKDYGKIKIMPNSDFTMRMELTPTQKKKLLELKKSIEEKK